MPYLSIYISRRVTITTATLFAILSKRKFCEIKERGKLFIYWNLLDIFGGGNDEIKKEILVRNLGSFLWVLNTGDFHDKTTSQSKFTFFLNGNLRKSQIPLKWFIFTEKVKQTFSYQKPEKTYYKSQNKLSEISPRIHFLTTLMTSSSAITWFAPTLCGEYLVLVPAK